MTSCAIQLGGEPLQLLPERAVHWPGGRTLFVADTHFGKAAALRSAGAAIPPGTTEADLARIDRLIDTTAALRLVVLGDFLHSPSSRAEGTLAALARFRVRRPQLDWWLVRGNHDRRAGDPPPPLAMRTLSAPTRLGPFELLHEPSEATGQAPFLCGHLHPGLVLRGGGDRLRVPCFAWDPQRGLVLPAFGALTGVHALKPTGPWRTFAIGEDRVWPWPPDLSEPCPDK